MHQNTKVNSIGLKPRPFRILVRLSRFSAWSHTGVPVSPNAELTDYRSESFNSSAAGLTGISLATNPSLLYIIQ